MQTGKWSFNPGLIPTLATLIMFPLLLTLGFWQLDRAAQKQTLYDNFIERTGRGSVDLNKLLALPGVADDILWRRGWIQGRYTDAGVFLLDNQVMGGRAGYFVYSPFEMAGTDLWILVNRGWVAAGDYRDRAPDIAEASGSYTLTGTVVDFPMSPGLLMSNDMQDSQALAPGVYRVQAVGRDVFEGLLGHTVYPYEFRLDQESASGFMRDWVQPGSGMERHLGYAFQWFALAAVLLVIYVSVNLQRRKFE